MSISNLGAVGYGYTPQATSFTAKPYKGTEDFQPGLIMPEQTEKKNKHTVLKTVVTIAALVGTAIVLKKHGKSIWNKIKGLFNKGGKAVEQAKKGMTEVNTSLNGLFESNGAKLTLKDGKIVKIQTPDGRSITKELNIAKYENKHGIDLSKLTPASAPKAKPVAPKAPETPDPAPKAETVATPKKTKAQAKAEALKKKQMDAAWKEYTQSKAPSADEILAQRQAELAKLDAKAAKSKDAQVSQAWTEHSPKVEAPKAETVAPKTEAPKTEAKVEDIFAQKEAEAARLKKQQMDEMWAAAGY